MLKGIGAFFRFMGRYLSLFLVIAIAAYGIFYPGLWENFSSYFRESKISVRMLIRALAVFLAILYLTKTIKLILHHSLKRFSVDSGIRDSFITLVGYCGILLGVAVALSIAGIDMKNITIVLGALSVGIGFGLQNIVNNFVSGIVILFERPIKVGDWVVVKNNEGIVKQINLRSTEVETFDRASVIIPNADILSNDFINWTHSSMLARVELKIRVAYHTDIDLMKDILIKCASQHPLVMNTPGPVVLFMELGENGIEFVLRFIIKDVHQRLATRSEVMFDVFRMFKQAGILVALPQRIVHNNSINMYENDEQPFYKETLKGSKK